MQGRTILGVASSCRAGGRLALLLLLASPLTLLTFGCRSTLEPAAGTAEAAAERAGAPVAEEAPPKRPANVIIDPDHESIAAAEDLRLPDAAPIQRALASSAPTLRARAARALGRIQDPASAPVLAEMATGDASPDVRRAALFALGQLGLAEGAAAPPEAVRAVRRVIDAGGEGDAAPLLPWAVQALGKLAPMDKSDGAAEALTPLLRHADAEVRREAAYALFRLRFVPVWRRQAEEPPALPKRSVDALLAAFDDPEAEVRRAAVYSFSRYGEPRAVAALTGRLGDSDEWTRLFAVRSLARALAEGTPEPSTVSAVVGTLGDESHHVRAEAVAATAALGAADRLPPGLAKDPSFHVRAALARALEQEESDAGLALLRTLESDLSPTVRTTAIEALAGRLGAAYEEALLDYLVTPDQPKRAQQAGAGPGRGWLIRAAATRAATRLGEDGRPLIHQAMSDTDARVRAAAVTALGLLPGDGKELGKALTDPDVGVRGAAVGAVAGRDDLPRLSMLTGAYLGSLGPEWVEIREGIVDAVGDLEEGDEVNKLLTTIAARDTAPSVRRRAAVALAGRGIEAPDAAEAPAPEPSPFLGRTFVYDPVVTLVTERGTLRIRLFASEAPVHVASFASLVEKGYYEGLIFHRVVTNFVIQGGDPRGDGTGGPGYSLRDEINPVPFRAGTVGMPKAGKDTGGGQIFIDHIPTPHLDGNYTVFGEVIDGMDVLDAIEVGDRILSATMEG